MAPSPSEAGPAAGAGTIGPQTADPDGQGGRKDERRPEKKFCAGRPSPLRVLRRL